MTTPNRAVKNLGVPVIAKPNINVTPLIDVFLVMLIIFMVVSPLRPARFPIAVPSPPDKTRTDVSPPINLLVVTIKSDRTLMLNGLTDMGSVSDTSKLSSLMDLFAKRLQNHDYRHEMRDRGDLPDASRIEKTVFIKAPRTLPYADVVQVIDSLKGAGATQLGYRLMILVGKSVALNSSLTANRHCLIHEALLYSIVS